MNLIQLVLLYLKFRNFKLNLIHNIWLIIIYNSPLLILNILFLLKIFLKDDIRFVRIDLNKNSVFIKNISYYDQYGFLRTNTDNNTRLLWKWKFESFDLSDVNKFTCIDLQFQNDSHYYKLFINKLSNNYELFDITNNDVKDNGNIMFGQINFNF